MNIILITIAILVAYAIRDAVALAGWPPRVALVANVLIILLLVVLYIGTTEHLFGRI